MATFQPPAFIPCRFDSAGEGTAFIVLRECTGFHLHTALFREKDRDRQTVLNHLWRLFQNAGGTSTDRIGVVLNLPGTTPNPEPVPTLPRDLPRGTTDRDFRRMAARR